MIVLRPKQLRADTHNDDNAEDRQPATESSNMQTSSRPNPCKLTIVLRATAGGEAVNRSNVYTMTLSLGRMELYQRSSVMEPMITGVITSLATCVSHTTQKQTLHFHFLFSTALLDETPSAKHPCPFIIALIIVITQHTQNRERGSQLGRACIQKKKKRSQNHTTTNHTEDNMKGSDILGGLRKGIRRKRVLENGMRQGTGKNIHNAIARYMITQIGSMST